ncbi:MAG TPA: zinc-ribbon domain-containing protein [Solirubrobacteraceae bacterium]
MKGPLHAIRRRRSERPANGVDTTQAATEAPTEAQPTAGLSSPPPRGASDQAPPTAEPGSTAQPTVLQPAPEAEVPAGQEPVPDRPSFRQRGRLRRRLRYLRRVRELGFRDLGGLIFDQHRFSRVNTTLVDGKLQALVAVDGELRALEHALDDRRPLTELREPGISVCSRCGALHGSEARFCPSCGTPVRGPRAIAEVGEAVTLPGGDVAPPPAAATPPPPAQPAAPARLQPQPLASEPPVPAPLAPAAPEPPRATDPVPAPAPADQDGQADAPPADGEQPTEVMGRADEHPGPTAGNGDAEALAQPTGEPREP